MYELFLTKWNWKCVCLQWSYFHPLLLITTHNKKANIYIYMTSSHTTDGKESKQQRPDETAAPAWMVSQAEGWIWWCWTSRRLLFSLILCFLLPVFLLNSLSSIALQPIRVFLLCYLRPLTHHQHLFCTFQSQSLGTLYTGWNAETPLASELSWEIDGKPNTHCSHRCKTLFIFLVLWVLSLS